MNRVRIVTDSTADLPRELVNKYGIIVVPLKLNLGKDVYRDGVDIKPDEFIARLEKADVMPTTSQPSPGEFVAVYENLIAKGESVISIHLSGKLSGTVSSALTAKTMVDSQDIHVIDSKTASMALGLIVLAAAQAALEGKSVKEILSIVKGKIETCFVIFLVDTLDYLEKGGRIGKASALLGTLLKIKPILTMEAGQVVPLEKARGKSRAIDRVIEIILEKTDGTRKYNCALVYGNDYAGMVKVKEKIHTVMNYNELIISELGPVIMSHTGPGLIGVVVCPD